MQTISDKDFTRACKTANSVFAMSTHAQPTPKIDKRERYYLEIIDQLNLLKPGVKLVDLGGGYSRFGPVASQLGPDVSIIDDFGGGGGVPACPNKDEERDMDSILEGYLHTLGINVIEMDILTERLPFETNSIDLITCFHVLEHFHHTPKRLFEEIQRVIKPGGYLFIATPNSVNIRKRIWVFFGKSNLPKIEDFYEQSPIWRGHVREPTVSDLKKILQWHDFEVCHITGRNFYGRDSRSLRLIPRPLRLAMVGIADVALCFFPSFCTDIHVIGKKQ